MTEKPSSPRDGSPGTPSAAGSGNPTRTLLVWLAVLCSLLLGLLSIAGTLLAPLRNYVLRVATDNHWSEGSRKFWENLPDSAEALFNSPAIVVFWIFLFMTLVSSILFSPRVLRRPASLAMHLGALLILGGAMWGSQRGHIAAAMIAKNHPSLASWVDGDRVRKGVLAVEEGQSENRLMQPRGAKLPFEVRLRDFRMEYYGPWELYAVVPERRRTDSGNDEVVQVPRRLSWTKGERLDLPESRFAIRVLEFLPHTRLGYPGGIPADLLIMAQGGARSIPVRAGQAAHLTLPTESGNVLIPGPSAMLVIDRVMAAAPSGGAHDETRPPLGAIASVFYADGRHRQVVITSQGPTREAGVPLALQEREAANLVDPQSELPAMDLELIAPDGRRHAFRLGQFRDTHGHIQGKPMPSLPTTQPVSDDPDEGIQLYLAEPPVKDYFSDVDILENGQVVRQATIEVNHPLHHNGYHLYQSSWDEENHAYTVLSVVSDRGLYAVYAGFALMLAGVFWVCWIMPMVRYVRAGRSAAEGR